MSYYIIIRGPLGVGKSTIAQRVARILKAEYVSIDSVLAKLGLDKASHYEECIPAKNFIQAQESILPHIKKALQKGKIVIFDACFYHKGQIEHLIKSLHYPHYVFTLKASLEACIERDSKRKKTYGKDAATAVYRLVSKFDYGTAIGEKNLDDTIKEILSYLPKSE